MKCVDLTSCVLNDKRALGGKEGSASTDKGIIVMTSYINLKLKESHRITLSIRTILFLRLVVSKAYEECSSHGFYKHTYAATNSFHTSFKRDDRRRELMKKRRVFLYLHKTYLTEKKHPATMNMNKNRTNDSHQHTQ